MSQSQDRDPAAWVDRAIERFLDQARQHVLRGKQSPIPGDHPFLRQQANCPTPNDSAFLCGLALRYDNYSQAAMFLSTALRDDPTRADLLALARRLYCAVDGQAEGVLPSLTAPQSAAFLIMHAWWLAESGDLSTALELLAQLSQRCPQIDHLRTWGLDWLTSEQAPDLVRTGVAAQTLARLSEDLPEFAIASPVDWRAAERASSVASRLSDVIGEPIEPACPEEENLVQARPSLLRKAGRFEEAQQWLDDRLNQDPNEVTALVLRAETWGASGDLDAAVTAFHDALAIAPGELGPRLKIADLLLDADRFAEALPWYEEVLHRQEDHAWARDSSTYCRLRMAPDATGLDALRARLTESSQDPSNTRARELASRLVPFEGELPTPGDDSITYLREQFDRYGAGRGLPESDFLDLDWVESPSTVLVHRWEAEHNPGWPLLKVRAGAIPDPDPRQACDPQIDSPWRFVGDHAEVNIAPPDPEVSLAVAYLASGRGTINDLWLRARPLARALRSRGPLDLLAVMVHPPEIPEGRPTRPGWLWIPRVQVTAAYLIAQMDHDWDDRSARRNALIALIRGPLDWTTTAAILALDGIAHTTVPAVQEITELFEELYDRTPTQGYWDHLHALFWHWGRLPGLGEDRRDQVRALRRKYYQKLDGHDPQDTDQSS